MTFGCQAAIADTACLHAPAPALQLSTDPGLVAKLQSYAARAANLRQRALQTGTVSYLEVIDFAYAPGLIDQEILRSKAAWRQSAHAGCIFVTDYATSTASADVRPLVAVEDARLLSTLVAQYESVSHSIGIAPVATDYAIFHEAGHSLQRAALQARGVAASRRTDAPGFIVPTATLSPMADMTSVHRLEYLCSQIEFEVRLQDLNRFYALITGRPIMDASDSLSALTALGVTLTYENTRDAYEHAGATLSAAAFSRLTSIPAVDPSAIAVSFEDARELTLVQRLALRIDASLWPPVLAKIIFEAPGHL